MPHNTQLDICKGCGQGIQPDDLRYSGQAFRGSHWHYDCWAKDQGPVRAPAAKKRPLSLRKPQRDVKPAPDDRAPDGFLVSGWRVVRKDGHVIFHRARHVHDFLAGLVGQYVYCEIVDWTGCELIVYPWGLQGRDRENGKLYTVSERGEWLEVGDNEPD